MGDNSFSPKSATNGISHSLQQIKNPACAGFYICNSSEPRTTKIKSLL
jgi:hypothetical protein